MTLAPLLFHVGYHKTGTTWMQNVLFRPAHGFRPLMDHPDVFEHIVRPHGLVFEPEPVRALLEARAAEAAGPDATRVVSSEILVGNPFLGGRESEVYARRLHRIAPEARILVTIREQLSMLVSVYMQYLLRGGTETPAAFFADDPVMGYVAFSPHHFEFHRLVGLYRELFGPDRVMVLTQEELVRDLDAAADRVARFAESPGVDHARLDRGRAAPSAPEFAAPLLRRLNHLRHGPAGPGPIVDLGRAGKTVYDGIGWLGRRPGVRTRLGRFRPVRGVVERRFAGRFAESNRRLAEMLGDAVDLSGYMR